MNFENYILRNDVFSQNVLKASSKDSNGKDIFSTFTLYLTPIIFLAEDLMS